jgi:hypothetical protein
MSQIPWIPGERLGDGADGEVFQVYGDESKVIKLGVFYEIDTTAQEHSIHLEKILTYLIQSHLDPYARVYEYKPLGFFERTVLGKKKPQTYFLYYYVMEKLSKLTEDEKKVFHTIVSHEDRNIKKNYAPEKLQKILAGLSRGLDFDVERVIFFHDNLRKTPVKHLDLHARNIMKDAAGNFKLIDFERAELSSRE